ncbi:hypothetical protein HDU96_010650 [Phlyctochytrium bullatum]|nr:hypothetical protein HDU96_010650 [Phlyctochytrium bullatum]
MRSFEDLTRTLRPDQDPDPTTLTDKIRLATELWNDTDAYFPRKPALILEWLNSAMTWSAAGVANADEAPAAGKGGKKGAKGDVGKREVDGIPPHADLRYWTLLDQVLLSISPAATTSGRPAAPRRRDFDPELVFDSSIRFAGFLGFLRALLAHVRAHPDATLVGVSGSCLRVLLGKGLVQSLLRPTMDGLVAVAVEALEGLAGGNGGDGEALEGRMEWVEMAGTVVKALHGSVVMGSSPKKTFSSITSGRLVFLLLRIRHQLNAGPATNQPLTDLKTDITRLLVDSLLHKDHIPEYIGVLKQLGDPLDAPPPSTSSNKRGGTARMSYAKRLFDVCAEATTSPAPASGPSNARLLADLLDLFLSLKDLRGHTASLDALETDAFSFGFALLALFWSYLAGCGDAERLAAGSMMLEAVAARGAYRRSRDAAAAYQRRVVQRVFEDAVGALEKADGARGAAVRVVGDVMGIDLGVVQERLETVLRILFENLDERTTSTTEYESFFCQLFRTLSKAHNLEQLLSTLLDVCEQSESDAALAFCLKKSVLDELRICIRRSLPAEAMAIMRMLATALKTIHTIHNGSGKVQKNAGTETASARAAFAEAELCAEFFSCCLQFSRLPDSFADEASRIIAGLHEEIVLQWLEKHGKPGLGVGKQDGKKRKRESTGNDEGGLWNSVLIVLLSSIEASESFWRTHVDTDFVKRVLAAPCEGDSKSEYLKTKISLLHVGLLANCSVDPRLNKGATDIVHSILKRFATLSSKALDTVAWDGDPSSLRANGQVLEIALFSVVLDNLSPICRLASTEELLELLRLVLLAAVMPVKGEVKTHNAATLPLLSKSLFFSSLFFELRPLRDAFYSAFSGVLSDTLQQFASAFPGAMRSSCEKLVSLMRAQKWQEAFAVAATKVQGMVTAQSTATAATGAVLFGILSLPLMCPVEYFSGQERQDLALSCLAVDFWLHSLLRSAGGFSEMIWEISGLARRVVARFVKYSNDVAAVFEQEQLLSALLDPLTALQSAAAISSVQKEAMDATMLVISAMLTNVFRKKGSACDKIVSIVKDKSVSGIAKSNDTAFGLALCFLTAVSKAYAHKASAWILKLLTRDAAGKANALASAPSVVRELAQMLYQLVLERKSVDLKHLTSAYYYAAEILDTSAALGLGPLLTTYMLSPGNRT